MKKTLKCFVVAALVLTMILSGTLTAFGAEASGLNVQYNGKNISLKGATTEMINGRAMVPFRQLLEAMGATVSYDTASRTVSAKLADKEISFAVGGTEITTVENGTKSVNKMDTAAFVEKKNNAIYVPVRAIAKSLEYCVGWDQTEKTVVIIDPATLFGTADEDFSIISKLMKSDLDMEKAYATTGKYNVDVTTYADPTSIMPGMAFSVTGKMSGIQQKSNADMVMNLAFNFDKMLEALPAEQKSFIEPMLAMYKNVDMKIKMNGETGTMYMNSAILSNLTGGDSNTWYKMDAYKSYEDMGINMQSMTNMSYSGLDLSEMLEESVANAPGVNAATYQEMETTYLFMKYLVGNDAFQSRTTSGVNTHILNINEDTIMKALARASEAEGLTEDSVDLTETGALLESMDLGTNIIIRDIDGVLENYELKGTFSMEEVSGSFDLSGDQKNAAGSFLVDQKDMMKMKIEVTSRITETSELPDLELPEDAKVIDYSMYPAN